MDLNFVLHQLQLPEEVRKELLEEFDPPLRKLSEPRTGASPFEEPRVSPLPVPAKDKEWPPKPEVGLYLSALNPADVDPLAQDADAKTNDRDVKQRLKAAAQRMRRAGQWRVLVDTPPGWRQALSLLGEDFPNFSEVISYLRAMLALSERRGAGINLGHMLLCGSPGIGKTLFCSELCAALGLPLVRIDMSSAQTASRMTGSDEYWSNTKPSVLFEILAWGEHGGVGNTVVLCDELDKARDDHRHSSISGLYALLEAHSARNWTDLSFPSVHLDASKLCFLTTANSTREISEPILSRLRVFHVPDPGVRERLAIAQNIWKRISNELENYEAPSLAILECLAMFGPREMTRVAREAYGRALADGRVTPVPADFPEPSQGASPPLGFA